MSGNYCLDANIFIESWKSIYPNDIFPSLWIKIAEHQPDIILVKPIFDEIVPSPLRTWLEEHNFGGIPIDDTVSQSAIDLGKKYQAKKPRTKGVNENDLILIAYAMFRGNIVVTHEAPQPQRPDNISNYKIPLVCELEGVECINFVGLLKELQIRI